MGLSLRTLRLLILISFLFSGYLCFKNPSSFSAFLFGLVGVVESDAQVSYKTFKVVHQLFFKFKIHTNKVHQPKDMFINKCCFFNMQCYFSQASILSRTLANSSCAAELSFLLLFLTTLSAFTSSKHCLFLFHLLSRSFFFFFLFRCINGCKWRRVRGKGADIYASDQNMQPQRFVIDCSRGRHTLTHTLS